MEINFKDIPTATMVLFAVIDVIGNIPIISDLRKKAGKIQSEKATLIAGAILISFLFLGKEILNVKFDYDLDISFNSRYLIDVASQLDGDDIEIYFKDTGSPALIKDPGDLDSIFVVMPMKG